METTWSMRLAGWESWPRNALGIDLAARIMSGMVPLAMPTAMVAPNTRIIGAGNSSEAGLEPSRKTIEPIDPNARTRPMMVAGSIRSTLAA